MSIIRRNLGRAVVAAVVGTSIAMFATTPASADADVSFDTLNWVKGSTVHATVDITPSMCPGLAAGSEVSIVFRTGGDGTTWDFPVSPLSPPPALPAYSSAGFGPFYLGVTPSPVTFEVPITDSMVEGPVATLWTMCIDSAFLYKGQAASEITGITISSPGGSSSEESALPNTGINGTTVAAVASSAALMLAAGAVVVTTRRRRANR